MSVIPGLPAKFHSHVINHENFQDQALKGTVESSSLLGLQGYYVSTIQNLVHSTRQFQVYAQVYTEEKGASALTYSIRKAAKMAELIKRHGLDDYVQVAKRYLYERDKVGYILEEELPTSFAFDKKIIITPEQARAITILAYEANWTCVRKDSSWGFTAQANKIAILDTTPYSRLAYKEMDGIFGWLISKRCVKMEESIVALNEFRKGIQDGRVIKAINQAENYYFALYAIERVCKIALFCSALIYTLPLVTGTLATAVAIPCSIIAVMKIACLALEILVPLIDVVEGRTIS